ncbi:MAG TPA: tetratricopeptide repeat protein [Caulobacteraceae bacterium]
MTDLQISAAPAIAAGREALLAGDPHTAVSLFERAVVIAPGEFEARYWLASALLTAGDPRAAEQMEEARTLHALTLARIMEADLGRCQTDAAYADAIASQLYGQKLVAISAVIRRLGLEAGTMSASAMLNYGLAMQHQGRVEEACEVFAAAGRAFPVAAAHQFLLPAVLFCDDGEARHAALAREWAGLYAKPPASAAHANPGRDGRKLRIGYVAPWFAENQLKQFITPLLENHDPAAVSVTLYPTDAASEAGKWPGWIDIHPLGQLSDTEAAAMIRRDGIDVLADCWGHTAGSRLPVFAHKPAPVQIAWLNFIQTTGLSQVDYVLHADGAATDEMASLFTEAIWRIGPVFNAFRPAAGRLPPVPTPALTAGRVTFGSFKHPAKLSGQALDGWTAVLRALPTSRLILKYGYFVDPVLQRATQARFAARGVAPERIEFAGHSSGEAYFQAFREIDLMLDGWPAPGSTTTLDALSNGVPVLVMAERNLAGQYAKSILDAAGLPELVAGTPQAFVERALELCRDLPRLDALRSRTRPAFEASPYCDEAGFARRVEGAFGRMFDRWQRRAAA